jgi:hypothetical protein
MTLLMRGTSSSRRQTVIIGAVLIAAVAVPKALAGDPISVPVDGAALAAVAISASTPVVPQAPAVPLVPETDAVSPVSPVIPPTVSPAPPSVPPTPGSPAGTPQSLAGEPAGGATAPASGAAVPGVAGVGKTPNSISSDITKKKPVILHHNHVKKAVHNALASCSRTASCKTPEPDPRRAAAATVRGRARELPSLGVTATELARGRPQHHDDKPRRSKPAREDAGAGGGEGPAPLVPEPPGRSPEAPPPSALTFSSQGAHGTGSFTVSASVTAFGVAAARAPTTAARSPSVQLRRRESDERIDRPG